MKAPTHLLFDFFGTLVSYSDSRVAQGFGESYRLLLEWGADIGHSRFLERWAEVFEEFEVRAKRSLVEYSMDAVCACFLEGTLPRVPDPSTIALFRDTYLEEWNRGVAYLPGVRELLEELSESFTLVLVTNTHHADLVRAHLAAMDVARHFKDVVTSVEHGKRKPSSCIFERALASSAGKPEASVYVGDSFEADYLGATRAGIESWLIDPAHRHDVPETARLGHILDVRARLGR